MILPAAPSLRLRLRLETRTAHDALDRSLDLMDRPLSLAQYGRLLGRFHGFHRTIEPALAGTLEPSLTVGRSKLAALRHDLQVCAVDGLLLPETPDLPPLDDRASALGAFYVVEGSTLGGRIIARHLRQQPGIPVDAFHYLEIYGRQSTEMWRAACTALEAVDVPGDADRAVETALATFAALHDWLDPTHWRDGRNEP